MTDTSKTKTARIWGVYHKAGKRIIYIGDAFFAFQPTVEKSRLCSYCQKKIAVI